MVHLHHLKLSMGRNRLLRVDFPDGKSVDRAIAAMTFSVDLPADPELIGGSWCGDHLDLDHILAGLGVGA